MRCGHGRAFHRGGRDSASFGETAAGATPAGAALFRRLRWVRTARGGNADEVRRYERDLPPLRISAIFPDMDGTGKCRRMVFAVRNAGTKAAHIRNGSGELLIFRSGD